MSSATEDLNFYLLINLHLNVNSLVWLVDTTLDSIALYCAEIFADY